LLVFIGELDKESNMQILHNTLSKYKPTAIYNLDVIISVGYRVKSQRGVKFRQWANRILKQYLVKGYAVNDRIRRDQLGELRQLVQVVGRTLQSQDVTATTDGQALFDVVVDYTYALNTLDNYDYERLVIERTTTKEPFRATYESRHATLPCHQKSFVQRRKQAHCSNFVPLVLEQQWYSLSCGWYEKIGG
jgi:hypothetical protein